MKFISVSQQLQLTIPYLQQKIFPYHINTSEECSPLTETRIERIKHAISYLITDFIILHLILSVPFPNFLY
jgi:hypothetical protein